MPKRYEGNCLECGKSFTRNYSKRFCGYPCSMAYVKKHNVHVSHKIICKGCSVEFSMKKDLRKYCTKECRSLNNKKRRDYPEVRNNASIKHKYNSILMRAKKRGWCISSMLDFVNWYKATSRICAYCDIPEEIWQHFYKSHQNRYSLTIDRIDSSIGYILSNLTLACSQCNTAKSNVFSHEEMRSISQMYIKPKWQNKIQVPMEVSLGI